MEACRNINKFYLSYKNNYFDKNYLSKISISYDKLFSYRKLSDYEEYIFDNEDVFEIKQNLDFIKEVFDYVTES